MGSFSLHCRVRPLFDDGTSIVSSQPTRTGPNTLGLSSSHFTQRSAMCGRLQCSGRSRCVGRTSGARRVHRAIRPHQAREYALGERIRSGSTAIEETAAAPYSQAACNESVSPHPKAFRWRTFLIPST